MRRVRMRCSFLLASQNEMVHDTNESRYHGGTVRLNRLLPGLPPPLRPRPPGVQGFELGAQVETPAPTIRYPVSACTTSDESSFNE